MRGFTLIELMTVISIAAILLMIGLPSLRGLIERSAMSGHLSTFAGAVNFARAEAIKRGATVVICRSENAATADSPTCATSGTGWESGWIVFLDRDWTAGTAAQLAETSGDVLLRVEGAIASSGGITQSEFAQLIFRPNGLMSGSAVNFTFKTKSLDAGLQRKVCLGVSGRAQVTTSSSESCS